LWPARLNGSVRRTSVLSHGDAQPRPSASVLGDLLNGSRERVVLRPTIRLSSVVAVLFFCRAPRRRGTVRGGPPSGGDVVCA
jgi:hypothetical protein